MQISEILKAWNKILKGERPSLSIEITRECPLRCPGCYAYEDAHLGGGVTLRELNDRKRKLSEMSFRVNKNNLNELENTPAYLRQGIDIGNEAVMPSQEKHMSSFTVSEDTFNQRPEIKQNNSFLHDQVD